MRSGFEWSALIAALAALATLVIALSALIQKIRSDNRAKWWRRVQWAVDRTHQDGQREREAGLISLRHLIEGRLATKQIESSSANSSTRSVDAVETRTEWKRLPNAKPATRRASYELAWSIVVRTSELLGEPVPDIDHDDGLHSLSAKSPRRG